MLLNFNTHVSPPILVIPHLQGLINTELCSELDIVLPQFPEWSVSQ